MLQVVAPRIWLPSMALLWALLSATLAAAKTPGQVMAIRFFQALAESSTFSGSHYILGSWYKESELGKRSGIFASSAQLGSLFSGVLQSAIIQGPLNHHLGLRSYQWLFLIDAFIGVPIALFGFLTFPDTPRKTKAWFLSAEERQLAIKRLPERPHTTMSRDLFKRVLKRWHWYAFSALFAFSSMLESPNINSLMQLWLKAEGYTQSQRNVSFCSSIQPRVCREADVDFPALPPRPRLGGHLRHDPLREPLRPLPLPLAGEHAHGTRPANHFDHPAHPLDPHICLLCSLLPQRHRVRRPSFELCVGE